MIAYWASPIDFYKENRQAEAVLYAWVDAAREILAEAGFIVFNPARAWDVSRTPYRELQEINLGILQRSALVVGVLPPGARTIGVPFELGYAEGAGLNWACVNGNPTSWALPRGNFASGEVLLVSQQSHVEDALSRFKFLVRAAAVQALARAQARAGTAGVV